MTEHPSAAFARALVAALTEHGVEDYVLSPGSRSGPLAHALAEAGSGNPPLGAPRVRLHVRIDERTAGFLALGVARGRATTGTARPVALVTTSGTAVGNLLPAVMEAHHAGVPLLLLTADRPEELRGVGANQTTTQPGIFGGFVQWSTDEPAPADGDQVPRAARLAATAVARALGDPSRDDMSGAPGPVHLNLSFRDPLGPDGGVWPGVPAAPARPEPRPDGGEPLPAVARGVVVAGDGAGDVARRVAEAHGWPLLAEPTSGARAGRAAIPDYVRLLTSPRGEELVRRTHLVVVVGRPTLSRPVQALIARAPSLHVAGFGARWREAPHHADRVLARVPAAWWGRSDAADPDWLASWRAAAGDTPSPEGWGPRVVAAEVAAAWRGGMLGVVGSSGPVRALDRVMPAARAGGAPTVLANRGLAGIDGTVSTAAGVALGSGRPVLALMGDVTFLHDAGGLLVGPLEERPELRIVVVNDGGGTLFSTLEHAGGDPDAVERVFLTPHGADLGALCAGYRVPHRRVGARDELAAALAAPLTGLEVIEARL
ncbi:2-succinyl-5-enolpyruvyl-6-hydroxy-3-cyclohexene-1-carboxylic-acid synthase [Demequina sp. SYSU T00068]|uniref:2-succinyl-5-enolpyruvyl-6-hydroxy-3- cyclohexene-1-carboxylic-acid synthase n=1 Tax=Demequina lignilytica TaxID=3051663 RepID=UPI002634B03C|nr:2-succinyl-5-enolpyruvyl-6-hydroxy-3-cyclohexene-1-carboxylic-acid synthase [Demequina sp. SYSU T00068]MDN4489932.1 2-succinyl-5-enolpyruvyl-6-hydroxy-3-cyclohexene-1-carboxylic-acid synthase [Demequina sp. SYSU T00068]